MNPGWMSPLWRYSILCQFGVLHSPPWQRAMWVWGMCRRLGTMKTCGRSRALNRVVAVLQRHVTATHGWSGHARFNIPDVPGLRDSSAIIGNLYELDNAIVIYLSDPHGIEVCFSAMFELCASLDDSHVSHVVRVWSPLSILTLIVL